ncbi:MAG TPA: penicillin-binding protein activator [Thioalkalivibrio sp.]|nr:penicillin-binding protein activator [Thioalkalivibrio sp.]
MELHPLTRMYSSRLISRLVMLLILALAVSGCETVPQRTADPEAARLEGERLVAAGERERAARYYADLAAGSRSPLREEYLMFAADAAATPDSLPQAKAYLSQVDERKLNAAGLARLRLTEAHILLVERRPNEALEKLPRVVDALPGRLQIDILSTRADALFATGKGIEGTQARLDVQTRLATPEQQQANLALLWEDLTLASSFDLYSWANETRDREIRGWLHLAYISRTTPPKPAALEAELGRWQAAYPGHPATGAILPDLRAQWREYATYPKQIALMLPLSGRYEVVGQSLLQGILAAWYQEENPDDRPQLRIYDIAERASEAMAFYDLAIEQGAEFVIGPFDKAALAAIGRNRQLPIPVLGLNYVDDRLETPDNFYQFGLLPEDEARQAAERASLDGHSNAIVLVPQGEWGERLAEAFRGRLEELGGTVLATETYLPSEADFQPAIKRALRLNDSQARYTQVRNIIKRDVHFEPRRRRDVDMVFMAATPREARLLRPQLDFLRASDLPVYATSHSFAGRIDTRADSDLNGVIFSDIPWLLDNLERPSERYRTIQATVPASVARQPRLLALGHDAYRVVPYLRRLKERDYERYEGLTGNLYIDAKGWMHRELKWAQFVNGRPRALATSEAPAEAKLADE